MSVSRFDLLPPNGPMSAHDSMTRINNIDNVEIGRRRWSLPSRASGPTLSRSSEWKRLVIGTISQSWPPLSLSGSPGRRRGQPPVKCHNSREFQRAIHQLIRLDWDARRGNMVVWVARRGGVCMQTTHRAAGALATTRKCYSSWADIFLFTVKQKLS